MKKVILILLIILFGYYWWGSTRSSTSQLQVGQSKVAVEVVETESERNLGLSGRESLPENEGMLFVFDYPAQHQFWMKEMKFGLDFVWIYQGKVVAVNESVPAPKGNEPPVTVRPQQAVDQVLEVNSGWVQTSGVKKGDQVIFN